MASEDQLISLRRRRGYCSGRFTYVSNRLDEYERSGQQQNSLLTNYEKQLTEAASQFEAFQLELEVLDEEEQARGFEIRDQYVAVAIKLQNLLRNAQAASPSTSINLPTCASSTSLNPIAIKLPDLRLPTFDGSLEKWNTFYDTFSSTIDKNPNLTDVQKFQYLQSALQGEAADCLNALPLSNVNYSQAIAVLKETFECPRYTIFSHCMAIIDYPRLARESPAELRRLVHTFKQHIYALNELGESYPDTSGMLNSLILSKVPLSIQKQWEITLPNNEVPPYIHLLNFLERLARSSRPITAVKQTRESPEQTTPVRQRAPRGHAFTATQVTPTCPTCQGQYPIWRCDTFKTKSLRERIGRSKERHYASTASEKGTQRNIVSRDHAAYAENDTIRCCTGQNIVQGLVPARPARNLPHQTVDPQHLPCRPTHHPLVAKNTQQTTDRKHHEQPRLQAHLPVTDEHTTNDADDRRLR